MKKLLSILLAGAMMMSFAACGSTTESSAPAESSDTASEATEGTTTTEPEMVLRYAENQPEDYPTTLAAYRFAEIVGEKTEGRIKVEVFAGAQLGDEKSVIEQLQLGTIDFTRVSLSPLSEFNNSLNVLQLPYLYTDADQMWRVLEGEIGQNYLDGMSEYNMYGLSWFDAGARNFYNSVRPITTLEDMAGLKIRVQESSLMMGLVEALGAQPTPMAYGEVYSGLQSGTIDGAENNWPSYESTSHYEVSQYIVLDEHTRVPEMQLIAKATMDKLSAEDQAIIKEAALESALYERELWAQRELDSEAKIADSITVTELADGELEKFQAAVQPLYDEFAADHMDIVEAIRNS